MKISLWRLGDAPPEFKELMPGAAPDDWVFHAPKGFVDQFSEAKPLPAFLNCEVGANQFRQFIHGLGFGSKHAHPQGDGIVAIFTQS